MQQCKNPRRAVFFPASGLRHAGVEKSSIKTVVSSGPRIVYIVPCRTYLPAAVALVEGVRYLTLNEADFQQKAFHINGSFTFA